MSGGGNVSGPDPLTDRKDRRGIHRTQRARRHRYVIELDGFGDGWLLDVLAAQVAGAGLDRRRSQKGAVGQNQFGGVEPPTEVPVTQVGSPVQALNCMP